ncbi:AbfB domain-containing protein [Actinoplanes sp. NPDC026619]|uniref:AbfB domain-containing protein n=1 Tax=Actinoplanes sp. NPDC026619 TaxID=3155798 RepID=UPI0033E88CB0
MPVRPPARPAETSAQARRVLLTCGAAVVAGVAGVMALLVTTAGDEPPGTTAQELAFPTLAPLTPVSLLPAPASSSAAPPPVVIATTTTPVAAHSTRPAWPSPTRTTKPAVPAVALVAGARVGLSIDGDPGLRLRHRNFVARADRIGSSSSALDKADSSFVVRTGLTGRGCISFESVNYPGYFLRHRDFVLRLEQRNRRESPELFGKDATFCPASTHGGAAVFLESINYPGRALHLDSGGIVHLDEGAGTAFVTRAALG